MQVNNRIIGRKHVISDTIGGAVFITTSGDTAIKTPHCTEWKRALSTRPSGRNECLGRNFPNFPGLDKAHCVLALTHLAVSSSVSASSTLGISCPYSDFIVSPL